MAGQRIAADVARIITLRLPSSTSAAGVRPTGRTARRSWRSRFLRSRGLIGLLVVGSVAVCVLSAPLITAYGPAAQRLLDALQPPSGAHPFGTDEFGRDLVTRVIYGARASLEVGLLSVGFAGVQGTFLGQLAGY